MEVAAKTILALVGFGPPGPRGTRTITLESDMVAVAISRGANILILRYCDVVLCLKMIYCFEVLVLFR